MLRSKIGLEALILTFSPREKGPPLALGEFSLRKKKAPLPSSPSGRRIKDEGKGVGLGEGWGDGNSIFENDRGRRDTPRRLTSAKIRRRVQTSLLKRC
jgi:hypothetical protein